MTAADPAISGTMNPPSGSGSTVSMPDGKGGSISLDKEGNAEYLKHWKNAAETAGSPYDHRIFSEHLAEKDLKQHESWLKASKIIYDMENGAGAWDERVIVKGWDTDKAKAELGSYGINYGAELFFQDSKAIWRPKANTAEQKLALRYLKDAYDHKDWNAASFTRAAWKSFSDPLNLGLMAVAAVAAPISGGASFALLGIGKKGVVETGKAAFKAVMTKIGRDTVVKEAAKETAEQVTKEAGETLTRKIAKDFAAKPAAHTAGKTLTGVAGNAALFSGLSGIATEDAFQKIEIDGAAAVGQKQEYDYMRTTGAGLTSAAMGAGLGVAMTVPVRPTVEALSDLVFDPIRNMKFLRSLAKEENANNAVEDAIKAKGQKAYDDKYGPLQQSGNPNAHNTAEEARKIKEEAAKELELQRKAGFELYKDKLDQTQKTAIKKAGFDDYKEILERLHRDNFIDQKTMDILVKAGVETGQDTQDTALANLLSQNANAAFALKKAEIARKTAETKAFYNGFQGADAAIESAGEAAYTKTFRESVEESKAAFEKLKQENNGESIYGDKEPDFEWAAEIAARNAKKAARDKEEAELEKNLGTYYQTIKKQQLAQIEQEALEVAKQSPAAKDFNSAKAILGFRQKALPPLELTTRTREFVDHVTHSYYKHISAIFGKGGKTDGSLIKGVEDVANELGKIGDDLANGKITRAKAEEHVLNAKQNHAKKTEEINHHLGDLRSNLDEIELRLKNARTRDDFTKSLDTSAQRWMPFPNLTIKVAKIRPHQIPKYMPYWPGEKIRDKEKQALIEFKHFLESQIVSVEKVAADHKKWTGDAFKAVDNAITNKASDAELSDGIKGAHKAVSEQAGALTHRVGKGDPLSVDMDENAARTSLSLKDRMFMTIESKNADYNEWLIRSIRESYANPYKRETPIQRPKDVYQNAEKLSWQIEKFWRNRDSVQPSDAQSMAGHFYNLYTAGMEQEALYAMRHLGYAFGRSEKAHGVKDMAQYNWIPAKVLPEIKELHATVGSADDKHFSYFLQAMKTTHERAMGGHHPGPVIQGGQRAIEKLYNDITFWPRYAFRHRGDGLMAVPGTEHYVVEPVRGAWGRQFGLNEDVLMYHLGKPLDQAKTQANKDADGALYKNVLQDDWGSKWMVPIRIVTRPIIDLGTPVWAIEKYTSLGAISKPGIYFAGAAGGAWALENSLETALEMDLPDTGASMLGAQLMVIDNTAMKLVRGGMWAVGLDNYTHHFDLEKNGLREFVRTKVGDAEPTTLTPDEKARLLIHRLTYDRAAGKPDTSNPLFMGRQTPGYLSAVSDIVGELKNGTLTKEGKTESEAVAEIIRKTKVHEEGEAKKRAAAVIHSLSARGLKKESDPNHALYLAPGTSAHDEAVKQIVEKNRILTTGEAEEIVRKIKGTPAQSQSSDPNLQNASHQQNPATAPAATTPPAAPAATVPPATVPPVAAPPQAATPAVSSTSAPPAPISTRSLGESWDSLASLPGRGLKAAYTFEGDMPREIEDVLNVGGGFLSGAFSLAGGLFSDLYNEKIEGGRWWLGAGAGLAGSIIVGQLVKQIPIIKHIPFVGIIGAIFAFPLVMRFTKGLLDGTMARQGGDKSYAPIVTSSVSSANPGANPGPAPAVSSVSHTGGAAVTKTLWEDKDNKHAVVNKITATDPDGTGPKKFAVQVHNDDGSNHASLEVLKDWQGQGQAPVFISKESLTAMGLSKEGFEYEAISHKDVNTQEDTPFISLRFMDNAKQVFQNVFIGAPEGYVPQ